MGSLRRRLALLVALTLLVAAALAARPDTPTAKANLACDAASGPAHVVTGGVGALTGGAIGGGNPVGDACNDVTNSAVGTVVSPVANALKGIGNGIFSQVTSWVTDGATWLIGRVVTLIDETTTPDLTTKGFVRQYGQMAAIAAFLAAAMLLLAVLEGLAQGNSAMLARVVFVNLPLAFVATSVAYVVVQLLIATTDGLSHAVAVSTTKNSHQFFQGAIHGLSQAGGTAGAVGGTATAGAGPGTATGGAAGATAAPLFVTFLAAIIAAFAAFFVWIELLMRDAAVYVVALFMPMALAASIWPRWTSALRRTSELLFVVIASKFVIVSIISLAAGLAATNNGQVEHILAAAALMLLACFAPFVLFRLVPFAEGAVAGAYSRRTAGAGAMNAAQSVSPAQLMRRTARSNWNDGGSGSIGPGGSSGGGPGSGPSGGFGGSGGVGSGGAGPAGAESGSAASASPAAALALPIAAAKGSQAAGQRLATTGISEQAGEVAKGQPDTQQDAGPRTQDDSTPQTPTESPGQEPLRPVPDLSATKRQGEATE